MALQLLFEFDRPKKRRRPPRRMTFDKPDFSAVSRVKPSKQDYNARETVHLIREMIYAQKRTLRFVIAWAIAERGWKQEDIEDVVFFRTWKSLISAEDGAAVGCWD